MPKKIEKDAAADEALTKIRKRLNKALVGFSSDFPADLNPWDMESSRPAAELFPVPELVLFAFRNIRSKTFWRRSLSNRPARATS